MKSLSQLSLNIYNQIESASYIGAFVFLWGFIFGVFVTSFIRISPLYSLFFIVLSILLCVILKFYTENSSKVILLLFLLLGSFFLGSMRYSIKDFHEIDPYLEKSVGSTVSLKGIVVSEPEHRENDIRFVVKTSADKIIVSSPFITHINYGDEINLEGKLERPGIIVSDSGRDFDYARYLSKDDIYYTIAFAKVSVVSEGKGNTIPAILYKIKQTFTNKINVLLAEPESSLLAGLLVSGKQALSKSILEEFRRAGVVHIVVLSGYNITIVAEFLRNIFSFLSFTLANSASLMGIVLFTLMTGATATVVRAATMALIVLLGKSLHRTYSVPRALLLAAFLMLIENPKILVFDPSFQLSFLAVLALVYVGPIVEGHMERVTERGGFRSILSTTIATQVTVLPYLLYSMGNVSIVSLISNILILIFVPLTMLLGFIATIFGFINYYLALPFAYLSHLLLFYILSVAHTLGNLRFASIKISHFPLWLMIILYLGFGVLILKHQKSILLSSEML